MSKFHGPELSSTICGLKIIHCYFMDQIKSVSLPMLIPYLSGDMDDILRVLKQKNVMYCNPDDLRLNKRTSV